MPSTHTDPSARTDGAEAELEEELFEEGEDEEIEPELEALFGLAQMDAEAVVAYEIVAQYVSVRTVHDKLLEFADDHRRHVDEIGRYLAEQGVEAATAMPEPETSSFATLANAMAGVSGSAALRSLQAAELFTNTTYASALELPLDDEGRALVQRNLDDEQRHASWLSDHQDSGWDDADAGEES